MTDFDHPKWPTRHTPDITTYDIGAKVTCTCGWWDTCPSTPAAARAFIAHVLLQAPRTRDDR